jgi:two-component system phosphate regulon response regulator PhoB
VSDVLLIDSTEKGLAPALREAGYAVRIALTGAAGLVSARASPPDAVVLVAALSDISGSEVCLALKSDPATQSASLIFVSPPSTDPDRVMGLELGADDSVTEPFSVREVVLRVQALLRRKGPTESHRSPEDLLAIDTAAHRVLVRGRDIHATALELRLLCALRDGGPRVQSRQALLSSAWGCEREVSSRTVDTHIKRLRRKLGPAAICIRSVRGTGYAFDSPLVQHFSGLPHRSSA